MLKPVAPQRRPMTTLADVVLRPAELADAAAVEAMHARCSETSLYRRFHTPLPRVSARMVRQLLKPTDGWSLLAERDGEVVALACAAPVSASEVEVGLLVEDRQQRQGIGTRLLHEVAVEATARGYRSAQVLAQSDNDRVLATVHRAGLIGRVSWVDQLLCISVPLRQPASRTLSRSA